MKIIGKLRKLYIGNEMITLSQGLDIIQALYPSSQTPCWYRVALGQLITDTLDLSQRRVMVTEKGNNSR